MKVILHDPKQAHEFLLNIWPKIKDALSNNRRLEMIIQDEKRTNDQNALFHAIIHQIAKEAEHMGARWDTESWKRFLVDQFSSEVFHKSGRVVPSLDNQRVVQLGLQTRDFSKQEATEFTEWLLAWAANAGIDVVMQAPELKDSYSTYMQSKNFPVEAIFKDISEVKSALRDRKVTFTGNIRLTGPVEQFQDRVRMRSIDGEALPNGSVPKWTEIIVRDQIRDQE